MASRTYNLFREAILEEKQVACTYNGRYRELCPIIIGHTKGEEMVLAYQVGGKSSRPLTPKDRWRCMAVSKVRDARLRDGPWDEGSGHKTEQTCVEIVDLDINIHVRPRREP